MPATSPRPSPSTTLSSDGSALVFCRTTGVVTTSMLTAVAGIYLLTLVVAGPTPGMDASSTAFRRYFADHHTILVVLGAAAAAGAAALAALGSAMSTLARLTRSTIGTRSDMARTGLTLLAMLWLTCGAAAVTAVATPADDLPSQPFRFALVLVAMTGPIAAVTVVTGTPRPHGTGPGGALYWYARLVALLEIALTLYTAGTGASGRGPLLTDFGATGAFALWAIWSSLHMTRTAQRCIRNSPPSAQPATTDS